MSYYTKDQMVFFGASVSADRWIEENINGAERASSPTVDADIPPTEVSPGVFRYLRKEPPTP